MEVGSFGLYLTQIGSSVPAANVNTACANPLVWANPVTGTGLTALARAAPVVPGSVTSFNSKNAKNSSDSNCDGDKVVPVPGWAKSFDHYLVCESNQNPTSKVYILILFVFVFLIEIDLILSIHRSLFLIFF